MCNNVKDKKELTGMDKIVHNAMLYSFRVKFGPFQKCPECYGLLKSCPLCQGREKVSVAEVESYNNPISKIMRKNSSNKERIAV
jgi:hypothetical protein